MTRESIAQGGPGTPGDPLDAGEKEIRQQPRGDRKRIYEEGPGPEGSLRKHLVQDCSVQGEAHVDGTRSQLARWLLVLFRNTELPLVGRNLTTLLNCGLRAHVRFLFSQAGRLARLDRPIKPCYTRPQVRRTGDDGMPMTPNHVQVMLRDLSSGVELIAADVAAAATQATNRFGYDASPAEVAAAWGALVGVEAQLQQALTLMAAIRALAKA